MQKKKKNKKKKTKPKNWWNVCWLQIYITIDYFKEKQNQNFCAGTTTKKRGEGSFYYFSSGRSHVGIKPSVSRSLVIQDKPQRQNFYVKSDF